MLVAPLFCTKGAAVMLENMVSRRNNLACFVRNFHTIGIHHRSNYNHNLVTAGVRNQFAFKSNMCTSSNKNDAMGNTTDIFSSVGAAGNLRFKKSGVNPVDVKREEPNFKVKQIADESMSSQDKLKQQAGFHDVSNPNLKRNCLAILLMPATARRLPLQLSNKGCWQPAGVQSAFKACHRYGRALTLSL